MRKVAVAASILLLPSWLAVYVLRGLGCPVHRTAKVGFSVVWVDKLAMAADAHIGHANLLMCRRVVMGAKAGIRSFNYVRGPFSLWMGSEAYIARRNQIVRARRPVSTGPAVLKMGELCQITSSHRFDCMRSVRIGNNSTFAGASSQVWTHGYIHAIRGRDRLRIDGRVTIGNNVSIGSGCIVSMGVTIVDGVNVGSHSSIAHDLEKPGLYVSQALRYIPKTAEDYDRQLIRDPSVTVEKVYRKREGGFGK